MMNQKEIAIAWVTAFVCCAVLDLDSVTAFSGELSRRQSIQAVIGGIATAVTSNVIPVFPANAVVDEETPRIVTRMGGLLVG
jgi:hypothetical protein